MKAQYNPLAAGGIVIHAYDFGPMAIASYVECPVGITREAEASDDMLTHLEMIVIRRSEAHRRATQVDYLPREKPTRFLISEPQGP